MIHRLLVRLALWYLRKYAPWALPYRPRPAIGSDFWRRQIDAIGAAMEQSKH